MRILVIEDDPKIAKAIKKGLEAESYAVDLSFEGKDGLANALSVDYDLLIIDRMLPEVDGLQICRILREKKVSTPILFLTAKDKVSDRVDGLNAGADDYLVKPFAFEELLARIRALLRRPSELDGTVLKIDDLVLDPAGFSVHRGKHEIKLSNKEFALLEYMMRNSGRILTKDNIITHVWDYDADILQNTVEVYIGYLRNKIDRAFPKSKPLIQTSRGFGYKISA